MNSINTNLILEKNINNGVLIENILFKNNHIIASFVETNNIIGNISFNTPKLNFNKNVIFDKYVLTNSISISTLSIASNLILNNQTRTNNLSVSQLTLSNLTIGCNLILSSQLELGGLKIQNGNIILKNTISCMFGSSEDNIFTKNELNNKYTDEFNIYGKCFVTVNDSNDDFMKILFKKGDNPTGYIKFHGLNDNKFLPCLTLFPGVQNVNTDLSNNINELYNTIHFLIPNLDDTAGSNNTLFRILKHTGSASLRRSVVSGTNRAGISSRLLIEWRNNETPLLRLFPNGTITMMGNTHFDLPFNQGTISGTFSSGSMYYDTTNNRLRVHNGTSFLSANQI